MYIVYYDESGDDGFPQYSSPLFVLTGLCLHHQNFHDIFEQLKYFRKTLKEFCGFPIKMEMHTKYFLVNKYPYKILNLNDDIRLQVIEVFLNVLTNLPIQVTNVVINKTIIKKQTYDILDTAFTYSLQRIENTIMHNDPGEKYLIITDEGRIGKMRHTARRMQKINYIPSQFNKISYRQEIKGLVEDPLVKESNQSYFIQISDMLAYIIYQYKLIELGLGQPPNRTPRDFDIKRIEKWLDMIYPILNIKASSIDPFGIVCYPK